MNDILGGLQDIVLERQLDNTHFSVVCEVRVKEYDKVVITKYVKHNNLFGLIDGQNEIRMLRFLEARCGANDPYPFFMKLLDVRKCQNSGSVMLFEKAYGDVFNIYSSITSYEQRIKLLKIHTPQLMLALSRLHALGVAHGDIKPENLVIRDGNDGPVSVVNGGGRLALIDFGTSSYCNPKDLAHVNVCVDGQLVPHVLNNRAFGTIPYMHPRVALGNRNTINMIEADIYSAGITIFSLFTGALPMASTLKKDAQQQIRQTFQDGSWAETVRMPNCLDRNSNDFKNWTAFVSLLCSGRVRDLSSSIVMDHAFLTCCEVKNCPK